MPSKNLKITRELIEAMIESYLEASKKCNADGVASLFLKDSNLTMSGETWVGQKQIRKQLEIEFADPYHQAPITEIESIDFDQLGVSAMVRERYTVQVGTTVKSGYAYMHVELIDSEVKIRAEVVISK